MVDWILQFYNLWGNKRFNISNSECCYIIFRVNKVKNSLNLMSFRMCHVGRLSIYIWKCNNTARLKNTFFSFYKNKKSILRNRKQKAWTGTYRCHSRRPPRRRDRCSRRNRPCSHMWRHSYTERSNTRLRLQIFTTYSQKKSYTRTRCLRCPCNIV